eukprot:1157153-Pelagomonas_calceolata.AAC.13
MQTRGMCTCLKSSTVKIRGLDNRWRRTAAACRPLQVNCVKAVTLHTVLLGVGGTCYTEHTLNQFEQLGLGHQRAIKLAHKLHAHSAKYACKPVTTGRAIENNDTSHSQLLEPGASSNPPYPH